jgi:hypothetical protein
MKVRRKEQARKIAQVVALEFGQRVDLRSGVLVEDGWVMMLLPGQRRNFEQAKVTFGGAVYLQ